jgi:hypothetical protein
MADTSSIPGLADLKSWASEEEVRLAELLVKEDQAHLFAGWKAGEDAAKKHAFFEQVRGPR